MKIYIKVLPLINSAFHSSASFFAIVVFPEPGFPITKKQHGFDSIKLCSTFIYINIIDEYNLAILKLYYLIFIIWI